MPSPTVYTCCKCSFEGSEIGNWGAHYYLDEDRKIVINRKTAICYGCASITTAERLPEEDHPNYPGYQERKSFLRDRLSPARCLKCGSHDFDIISNVDPQDESRKLDLPFRTGLIHRNCGGRIYADTSGPNVFMGNRLPVRLFSKEGTLVKCVHTD